MDADMSLDIDSFFTDYFKGVVSTLKMMDNITIDSQGYTD
jgi:hypothetical protein